MRFCPILTGVIVAGALIFCGSAWADDQPFVTLYTTDIQPEHGREIEQWLSWSANHANESFNDVLERTELEYGITDDLQGSLYLSYDWARTHAHLPPGPVETENAIGASGEVIWRLQNPYFDPFGFALYLEPAWSAKLRSIEAKLLFQKNFLNDKLRTALNVNFEDRWEENDFGHFDKVSALEFNLGASYNVTPDLSAGLEFDNERGFDGLILGTAASEQSDSYYLGPTIQYVGHPWSITLGAQTQLPIAGNPTHDPGAVTAGYTSADEHFRMTLRVTSDF